MSPNTNPSTFGSVGMSSVTMNAAANATSGPRTTTTISSTAPPSSVTSTNGIGTSATASGVGHSSHLHAASTLTAPPAVAPTSGALPNPFQQPPSQLKAPPPSSSSSSTTPSLVPALNPIMAAPTTAASVATTAQPTNVVLQQQRQQHLSEEERIKFIRPTAATSGTKRTLLTHTKDGKMLSEKKLRRLEKNRLSARECRRRKREATENLEREINVLEAENMRLRLQLQIGKEAEKSRLKEQEKLTQDIDELLKSGASEAEVHAQLEEFKEKHADYGKSRRSATEFHLRNIKRLLMPTQTTSLVMQAMQGGGTTTAAAAAVAPAAASVGAPQSGPETTLLNHLGAGNNGNHNHPPAAALAPPAAAVVAAPPAAAAAAATNTTTSNTSQKSSNNNNMDPKALFRYLVQHLDVTPQQAAALKDSRFVASELDSCLEKALAVLTELQERLAQTAVDLEAEFNNVRQILTPTQAAKFLVWVANNHACMHLLNELWDRVHPPAVDHEVDAADGIERTSSIDEDSA